MPDKLNYYIAEAFDGNIFTAGIVRKHQEVIMHAEGFKPLVFNYNSHWGILFKGFRVLQSVKMAFSISKNSTVYFHFPFLAGIYSLLQKLLHWRGIKTVALIIDIDGLRDRDAVLLKNELNELSRFTCIIAHNEAMKVYILSQLPGATIQCIQLFDYEFKGNAGEKELSGSVCFAGNLKKSSFVYNLNQLIKLEFYLYGESYIPSGGVADNIFYKGKVDPAKLPAVLLGSFGLVWDGDSIETCNDYLRYNNPHKLSLYLAAGLPVIVWKQSAVAAFVEENGVGIAVDSLTALDHSIEQLSSEEYNKMQNATAAISKNIKEGYYFRNVLLSVAPL